MLHTIIFHLYCFAIGNQSIYTRNNTSSVLQNIFIMEASNNGKIYSIGDDGLIGIINALTADNDVVQEMHMSVAHCVHSGTWEERVVVRVELAVVFDSDPFLSRSFV